MGNWNITIRGVGCHHNDGLPSDANRMAADFVKALEAAGHQVHEASITYGAEDQIQRKQGYGPAGSAKMADEYIAERDKIEADAKAYRESQKK